MVFMYCHLHRSLSHILVQQCPSGTVVTHGWVDSLCCISVMSPTEQLMCLLSAYYQLTICFSSISTFFGMMFLSRRISRVLSLDLQTCLRTSFSPGCKHVGIGFLLEFSSCKVYTLWRYSSLYRKINIHEVNSHEFVNDSKNNTAPMITQ